MVVDVAEKAPGWLRAVAYDLVALMRFHSPSLGHKAAALFRAAAAPRPFGRALGAAFLRNQPLHCAVEFAVILPKK